MQILSREEMMDHIQRLTASNRKLVMDLNMAKAFIASLLDPEMYGHAVSDEVRQKALQLLNREKPVTYEHQ